MQSKGRECDFVELGGASGGEARTHRNGKIDLFTAVHDNNDLAVKEKPKAIFGE
jgi:hypothetical protein